MCGGQERVCAANDRHCNGGGGCEDGIPCPTCRRVVSIEDAELAAAVREIEAEGLWASLYHSDGEVWWRVHAVPGRTEGSEVNGNAHTLREALDEYLKDEELAATRGKS